MEYQHFIKLLQTYKTSFIQPIDLPNSCSPQQIPTAFSALIPDILRIMEAHFAQLAAGKPLLGVFGLQVVTHAYESSLPIKLGRIIKQDMPRQHFCCTLSFLPITPVELNSINNWHNAKSIIIDFTRGVVMDENYYSHEILRTYNLGKIYGNFSEHKLEIAWRAIQNRPLSIAHH